MKDESQPIIPGCLKNAVRFDFNCLTALAMSLM